MPKPTTESTCEANRKFRDKVPFHKTDDLDAVRRGLIAETPDLVIRNARGDVVWDMKTFYELMGKEQDAPDTVNPSYWRHEQKETVAGLFEVADGIWQVRGYDPANLTLIRSDHGYIVVDALTSPETARAALEFAFSHLGKKPVVALVVTHSHMDHYNGIPGLVDVADIESGKIPLIVPARFTDEIGNENIFVGRAMRRRTAYQFGQALPKGPEGTLGAGLCKSLPPAAVEYVRPTRYIRETGETLNIDGVEFVFQMTPEAEAPAEFCFYLPQFRALCMAELVNDLQHNLLPLRGAQARSAKMWARHLQEALNLFGTRTDVLFIGHHGPTCGGENVRALLSRQRDLYKFINDQTIRLINHGETMTEIAEKLELPDALGQDWNNRGYYGHLNHNVKATYQRYLGWFDCNPANLNPLPPEEAGRRYVACMGGVDETLAKARKSFEDGEYRWAATVLNHLVFGHPGCRDARELLADTYEQLGYQAECGTWRNCYLNGARELREGLPPASHQSTLSPTAVANMPTELLLDYLATQVEPQKAEGKSVSVNLHFTDSGEHWNWSLENSVMNCWNAALSGADASYTLTRAALDAIVNEETSVEGAISDGLIREKGRKGALAELFAVLEERPDFFFGIVTP